MTVAVDTYKKCLKCGDKYHIESDRTHCFCGGYLYTVSNIYQPKVRKEHEQ